MPTPTYTAVANLTIGSNQSTISVSSITQVYKDLSIKISAPNGGVSNGSVYMRVNGDAGGNYTYQANYASGGTLYDGATQIYMHYGSSNDSRYPFILSIDAMEYSATDRHKQFLCNRGQGNADAFDQVSGRWSNTGAVTSLTFTHASTFVAGTNITIFGIVA